MSKRVTLEDDELELIIEWLEGVGDPIRLEGFYYTKRWSQIATKRLLAKLTKTSTPAIQKNDHDIRSSLEGGNH